MAEKPKNPPVNSKQAPNTNTAEQQPEEAKSKFSLLFKIAFVALALCILVAIGFAAGVYLKFIDVDKLAGDLNLSRHAVVERFFPKTNFEPVELEDDDIAQPELPNPVMQNQLAHSQHSPATPALPAEQPITPNTITKEELEKQTKLKQQEEAKRIAKLARLYAGMKPEAAVAIINELDDPTVIAIFGKMEEEQVSKILSLLDSKRAARLSEDMLKGRVQQPIL